MINRLAGQYYSTSEKLSFYTSENKSTRIKITEIAAKKIPQGFAGILQWLDPTRVTLKISDKKTHRVSVSIHKLSKILGVSVFRLFLARLNPFSSLESFVGKKLRSNKFSKIVVKSLAAKYAASHPDEKVFKISRKIFPYLKNSYLVETKAQNDLDIYRFEKEYSYKDNRLHNKLIGEGGFKKVKELRNIETARKMALALWKNGSLKKFEDEIQLHEKFLNVPHFAQGKRISWINSKKVKKTAILMPCYSHTMSTAASRIRSTKVKNKCSLEVALAIKHLFDNGLFHFDIKPDNIFVDISKTGNVHAYLGDLGGIRQFSTLLSDLWDSGKSLFGFKVKSKNNIQQNGLEYTPLYAAPELAYSTYSEKGLKKAVVYSFGKTLLDWYAGDRIAHSMKTMMHNAVSKNPDYRPSIEAIIHRLKTQVSTNFRPRLF